MSSTSNMGELARPPETELQIEAREAAIAVEDVFETTSELLNDDLAGMVALFDPEEIILGEKMQSTDEFLVVALKAISIRYERDPPFDYEMEEARDRFADRSHDAFFAVKSISPESVKKDKKTAAEAGASLMIEVKILMNLEKHPNICQVYGLSASGPMACFGSDHLEDNFFLIIDAISETLPERLKSWKEKKRYEGERFDDLASRQSRLTQRLEVALEISSAMTFLASRNLVFFLHPEKVGFDVRYTRIKLFQFGSAREGGKDPYFPYQEENDMKKRVYLAPEFYRQKTVTVSADVFSFGMLMWEILTLTPPFEGMSREAHLADVVDGRTRPTLNRSWPGDLRHLLEDCWAPSKRPTMKQVYDRLEGCLLFQDFNGIDKTENHSRNVVPQPQNKNRKIRYQRNAAETITEEERDRDARSTRSKDSVRSKESTKSRRSDDTNENDKKNNRSKHRRQTVGAESEEADKSSNPLSPPESDHKSVDENEKKIGQHSRRKSSGANAEAHDKSSSSRHRKRVDGDERSVRSSRKTGEDDSTEIETLPLNDAESPVDRRRSNKDADNKIRRSRSRDSNSNHDNDAKSVASRSVKSRESKMRRGASSRSFNEHPEQKAVRRRSLDPSLKRDSNTADKNEADSGNYDTGTKENDGSSRSIVKRRVSRRDENENQNSGRRPRSKSIDKSIRDSNTSDKNVADSGNYDTGTKENGGSARSVVKRRVSRRDDNENQSSGRRSRSKSIDKSIRDSNAADKNEAESGNYDAGTKENGGSARSVVKRRVSRREDNENQNSGRRSRSKSNDAASQHGSSRRINAPRETSSRRLGRSKSDEVGGIERVTRETSSRKIGRNKSSDSADLANLSPEKSPGSIRSTRSKMSEGSVSTTSRKSTRDAPRKLSRAQSVAIAGGREPPIKRGVQRTMSSDGHALGRHVARELPRDQNECKDFSRSFRSLNESRVETEEKGAEAEPDRRGKLSPSKSGLLKPAVKDTSKISRARLKREKSAPSILSPETSASTVRAQQRRDEYNKAVLAATHIGQKEPLKRRKSTKKSFDQDNTLLKEVFVED